MVTRSDASENRPMVVRDGETEIEDDRIFAFLQSWKIVLLFFENTVLEIQIFNKRDLEILH